MWAWTLGGTVVVAAVYMVWRGNRTAAEDETADQVPSYASPTGEIVPVNQGLGAQQAEDILAAIQGIQGPASTATAAQQLEAKKQAAQLGIAKKAQAVLKQKLAAAIAARKKSEAARKKAEAARKKAAAALKKAKKKKK